MRNNILIIMFLITATTFSQSKIGDTLYLKFDRNIIAQNKLPVERSTFFYFKEDINSEDAFYFTIESTKIIKSFVEKTICLKKLLKTHDLIKTKNNKTFIHDIELYSIFENKEPFLLKNDSLFKLKPNYLIAD